MRAAERRLAGLALAAFVALLAAACGGSKGSPASTESSQARGAIAYAGCMRSNGVPKFPDPDSSGRIPKVALAQLGVASTQFQAAQASCRQLLPNGGQAPSQAQLLQIKALGLKFAQCVRAHGVPNLPDPDASGRIPDPASVGINQGSPKFQAANDACAKWRPPYMPSNAAYDAYARTQTSGP